MTHRRKFAERLPLYRAFSLMPSLSHWPDRTQPFDYAKSEVVAFLVDQGATAEQAKAAFEAVSSKGVIRFDPATKLWTGTGSTAKLEAIEHRLSGRGQRKKKTGNPDGLRSNSRQRSAESALKAWQDNGGSTARFSDIMRAFMAQGIAENTAKKYIFALKQSGHLVRTESGAWTVEQ